MSDRCCENCRFWMTPDPTGKIGNQGMCSAFARRGYNSKSNPVAPAVKRPFWATDLTAMTTSWQGVHCATFQQKKEAPKS